MDVSGFVSAIGQTIINGDGKEILLRGVGFGSWFLPEGYMWCFPEGGDRPVRIEKMIKDLIGTEKASQFWQEYYDSYITEDDIRTISEEGFNSVRLPINYRYLLNSDRPFARIDLLLEWCRKYKIYVILDLHGAPGGQTGTNIDDSENDLPELFTDESNARLTVEIWRRMALRYKDEWIIAGYDLLNEPLPEWFSNYNEKVIPLYKEIIKEIREVDKKHMIILEGVHWASDWSIFDEKLDENLMLQFHKYWNNPDVESIEPYLIKRDELNVPIFMGEGGENNSDWYSGAFRLFEDMDISWNFWTWKKMDTDNSPFSIEKPTDWELLVNYLNGGRKPYRDEAVSILWEYLNNLKFSNSIYRPEICRSLLRRPPLRIPAIFSTFHREVESFTQENQDVKSHIDFRKKDDIHFGFTAGNRDIPNFQHGEGQQWEDDEWMYVQLKRGETLTYDFLIDSKSENIPFSISIKMRSCDKESSIKLTIESLEYEDIYKSGSLWNTIRGSVTFSAQPGYKRISIKAEDGPVQIERINIDSV